MKAFVYQISGEFRVNRVSPEYHSKQNFERYYLRTLPVGSYRVLFYPNWDHRYSTNPRDFEEYVYKIEAKGELV